MQNNRKNQIEQIQRNAAHRENKFETRQKKIVTEIELINIFEGQLNEKQ